MKKLTPLLLLLFIFMMPGTPASAQHLSPDARISLLTASPGEELYTAFGHSALWVSDPVHGIDEVYNWGTFDFDTPNFYMKFLQGRLLYQLSVTSLTQFLWSYHHAGRELVEQELHLQPEEKDRIYAFLLVNRRPENIDYLYDFFFDNCATRIRDLVDHELDIDWGTPPEAVEPRTFRQMLRPYTEHAPWISFGIDILLGLPADQLASPWHQMFLPDDMFDAFNHARHEDGRLLVHAYNEILPRTAETPEAFPIQPHWTFWLLFLAGVASTWSAKTFAVLRSVFFFVTGLLGVIVFFMWFLSDHIATAHNLDILWALPTHAWFAFRMHKAHLSRTTRLYMKIVFILSLLLLVTWPLNPQEFHVATIPIIALSALFTAPAVFPGLRLLSKKQAATSNSNLP